MAKHVYPCVAYHKDYNKNLQVHVGPEVEKNLKLEKLVKSEAEHKKLGADWGYVEEHSGPDEVQTNQAMSDVEEQLPKKKRVLR